MTVMPVIFLLIVLLAGQAAPPAVVPGSTPNTRRLAEGAPRPAAKVSDFAWLAGIWAGEGLGGQVDEVWSAPTGGTMVGHFRLVRDGKPVFYELLTLVEVEGSVEMRLKHMNPDMTGWEEKSAFVTFKLVTVDDTGAYFGPFTIRRTGPDSWDGFLAMQQGGQTREQKFSFQRMSVREPGATEARSAFNTASTSMSSWAIAPVTGGR